MTTPRGRSSSAGRWAWLAAALGCGAGAHAPAGAIPEESRFSLACHALRPGSPAVPDTRAPQVVLADIADRRFVGDTIGWGEGASIAEAAAGDGALDLDRSVTEQVAEEIAASLFRAFLDPPGDSVPLLLDPPGLAVLRRDLREVLGRAGFRPVDSAAAAEGTAGAPALGGELQRLEVFIRRHQRRDHEMLAGFAAIELVLRRGEDRPAWHRRFEAEADGKGGWQEGRGALERLMDRVWCDLLGQVQEAVAAPDFAAAVRGGERR